MERIVITLLFCVLWVTTHGDVMTEKLFILEKGSGENSQRMLVVTWDKEEEMDEGCEVFNDLELIDEVLSSSQDHIVRKTTEDEMEILLENCEFTMRRRRRDSGSFPDEKSPRSRYATGYSNSSRGREGRRINTGNDKSRNSGDDKSSNTSNRQQDTNERRGNSSNEKNSNKRYKEEPPLEDWGAPSTVPTTTEGYSGWPVIWPGTKWCGAGDIAKNYDDLGLHQDTDRCCRAHDLCNDTMAPGETKNNLTNSSPFTKLSCQCDKDFYHCLDKVNTVISNSIGNMYFNVLRRECYSKDYPNTKKCKKYYSFLKIRCKEYEKDTNAQLIYQWEKAEKYKKIPFPGPLTFTLPF